MTDNLGEIAFKFDIVVFKKSLKISFPILFINDFLYLFGLSLDQLYHLNITYIYPEEAMYTFNLYIAWGQTTV